MGVGILLGVATIVPGILDIAPVPTSAPVVRTASDASGERSERTESSDPDMRGSDVASASPDPGEEESAPQAMGTSSCTESVAGDDGAGSGAGDSELQKVGDDWREFASGFLSYAVATSLLELAVCMQHALPEDDPLYPLFKTIERYLESRGFKLGDDGDAGDGGAGPEGTLDGLLDSFALVLLASRASWAKVRDLGVSDRTDGYIEAKLDDLDALIGLLPPSGDSGCEGEGASEG